MCLHNFVKYRGKREKNGAGEENKEGNKEGKNGQEEKKGKKTPTNIKRIHKEK